MDGQPEMVVNHKQWQWKVTVENDLDPNYLVARVWERYIDEAGSSPWRSVGIGGCWRAQYFGRHRQAFLAALKNAVRLK